jgi:sRNA-binding protein
LLHPGRDIVHRLAKGLVDRLVPDTHLLGMFIEAKPERPKRERREREDKPKKPRKEEARSAHERHKAERPRREREPEVEGTDPNGRMERLGAELLDLSAL